MMWVYKCSSLGRSAGSKNNYERILIRLITRPRETGNGR